MQQARLCLRRRPRGAAWALLQFDSTCEGQDKVTVCCCRGCTIDQGTDRGRARVPQSRGTVLGCLRTLGGRTAPWARPEPRDGGSKRGLQTTLSAEVLAEVEQFIGKQAVAALDLEALENAVRREALRIAGKAIEQWLNEDTSDHAGSQLICKCGQQARFAGRRRKSFESVLGTLELERAYYHCAHCGEGFYPRDRQFGVENSSVSPAVARMICSVGALVSFEEGSQLLSELAGVKVTPKQVERTAEALGEQIAADEKQDCIPLDETALPSTLYLGMDGTGIPMRKSELQGRTGKQPDGSAKTREVKLCTVWSADSRDEEGRPVRDEGSVSYSAAIETAATLDSDEDLADFPLRVEREAMRRRFTQAKRTVVIGDGAPWIWNIADELFPSAVQIVDRYHVKEYLSTVGKAIYGAASDAARLWSERRHEELDTGRFSNLIRAVRRHANRCSEARKCVRYLQRNRERIQYPKFEAAGICTSSGVVEAGCKVAIGTRLKRAGMHWTVRGANAIIALRCSRLSGRFEDFWERRAAA